MKLKLLKELPMPGNNSIIPDVYIEFESGGWLTVEVIKTSPPSREVHEYCGSQMIVLDLNELGFIDDDRAFSKWIQSGGVAEMLRANAIPEVRQRRFDERENEWKRKDEREFRAAVRTKISECQQRFGFQYTGDEAQVSHTEDIEEWFEAEQTRKELRKSIQDAIDANAEKYGENLGRDADDFSSPEEVNKFYQNHFRERIKQERAAKRAAKKQLAADIEAAKNELEAELDINIRKHFETMEEFEEYAQGKRHEREKKRLKEELAPLIADLEKELNIEVTRRFSTRDDFDRYAGRMREAYWSRSLEERTLEAYHRMHDEEVMQYSEEYDTYLAEKHSTLTYDKRWKKLNEQMEEVKNRLLLWSFVCDKFPLLSTGLSHMLKTGPFVRHPGECLAIDQVCKKRGKHKCNHHKSEHAEELIRRIKADMYDPNKGMMTIEQRREWLSTKDTPRESEGGQNRGSTQDSQPNTAKADGPHLTTTEAQPRTDSAEVTQPEQPRRATRAERLEQSRAYLERNSANRTQRGTGEERA